MSYCVNCGVLLPEGSLKCPLCDCPVVNPYESAGAAETVKKPECRETDDAPVTSWRDVVHFVITLTLVFGCVTCGIVNLSVSGRLSWAYIPFAASALAYISVALPMKRRRLSCELSILFDYIAVMLLLTVIAWRSGSFVWAVSVSYPVATVTAVFAVILAHLISKHRIRYFHICAIGFVLAGLLAVLTELLINGGDDIVWSGIVLVTCVAVAAILSIIAKSRRLSRRFHI